MKRSENIFTTRMPPAPAQYRIGKGSVAFAAQYWVALLELSSDTRPEGCFAVAVCNDLKRDTREGTLAIIHKELCVSLGLGSMRW